MKLIAIRELNPKTLSVNCAILMRLKTNAIFHFPVLHYIPPASESLFKEDKKYIRLTEINSRENCFKKPNCCSCIVLSMFYHDWINGLTVAAAVFMATTAPGFVPVTASVRVAGCVMDAVTAFPLRWK